MDEDALEVWHRFVGKSIVAASPTVVTYDAGYVVLSFFTSLIGCLTTIELIQRRTSKRGAYNWYALMISRSQPG
jgi:NO-binding membrane sensor protein with MHYT domain